MKRTRKLISLILAVLLLAGTASVAAYAYDPSEYIPSIVIPGIFQSEVKYYENGEVALNSEGEPYSAPFFLDTTTEIVGAALMEALIPISKMLISQEDKDQRAAKAVADVLGSTLMEKSRCDEDGRFVHDVRATKYNDSYADLSEYDREYIMDAVPLKNYVDVAGEENLYFFSYASLGNMIDTATELYDFIQFVKEDSGSEKVNIIPISQGGSIADALMQIYEDKGRSLAEDIYKMLLVVPAIDGSILVGEIYQYGLLDDNFEIYSQMFPSLMGDDEWLSYLINVVIRIMPNADLNAILDQAATTLVMDYMRFSTLMWGLVPSANYEPCREMYLSDEAASKLLPQTDWFYSAQTNAHRHILEAIEDGVKVFDIVDYNQSLYELVDSWDDVNADGIIQLDGESLGAYSAGVDKPLPEGYVRTRNNCTDPSHDHSDPNNIVDPCTGLLPETTFYFFNQNHERTASNDIIMKLACAILTREDFVSVFSYTSEFPQFNGARNTKGFMNDLDEMRLKADGTRNIDVSGISAEIITELDAAIAEGDLALSDTVVSAASEAAIENARGRFYDVRAIVLNGGTAPTPEVPEDEGFDFNTLLIKFFKTLSDFLFNLFKGEGFSEMINNKDPDLSIFA